MLKYITLRFNNKRSLEECLRSNQTNARAVSVCIGKYTSVCDVWSYGILAWEIYSLGASPYCGMSNSRARELIDTGYRLPAPEKVPDTVYQLMLQCWEYNPDKRPTFQEIHQTLVSVGRHV